MTDSEAFQIIKIADKELYASGLSYKELIEYRDICKRGLDHANIWLRKRKNKNENQGNQDL